MTKKKLIELRCKAWGITEDEYYCNQCSDFSLEDMARAYRRGKNKGRADLEAQIEKMKCCYNCKQSQDESYCKIKKSDVNDLSCWDCGCDKWEIKENE